MKALKRMAHIPLPSQRGSVCQARNLSLEVPKLQQQKSHSQLRFEKGQSRFGQKTTMTYNPSSTFAVRPFLGVCPLVEERVRGIELGRKSPFTEPERRVTEGGIVLDTL